MPDILDKAVTGIAAGAIDFLNQIEQDKQDRKKQKAAIMLEAVKEDFLAKRQMARDTIMAQQKAGAMAATEQQRSVQNLMRMTSLVDRNVRSKVAQDVGGFDPISGNNINLGFTVTPDVRQILYALRSVQEFDRYGLPEQSKDAIASYLGLDKVKQSDKVKKLYSGLQRFDAQKVGDLIKSGMVLNVGQILKSIGTTRPSLESNEEPFAIEPKSVGGASMGNTSSDDSQFWGE
jgi:hypothetical protein